MWCCLMRKLAAHVQSPQTAAPTSGASSNGEHTEQPRKPFYLTVHSDAAGQCLPARDRSRHYHHGVYAACHRQRLLRVATPGNRFTLEIHTRNTRGRRLRCGGLLLPVYYLSDSWHLSVAVICSEIRLIGTEQHKHLNMTV